MVQRCRRYKRNEVMFFCDPGLRDYGVAPGYNHAVADEVPEGKGPALEFDSVALAKAAMDHEHRDYKDGEYFVRTKRGLYRFSRRKTTTLHVG